jgi:hypothetical protein
MKIRQPRPPPAQSGTSRCLCSVLIVVGLSALSIGCFCVLSWNILPSHRSSGVHDVIMLNTRAFEKFVDSPYDSESELCGGAVTVSFSKYLPWKAMHSLQRSTHISKTCCRSFAASFRRIVEQAVLTFHVRFSVSKALPPLENRSSSHCIVSTGLMDEVWGFRIHSRNADVPLRKYLVVPPS